MSEADCIERNKVLEMMPYAAMDICGCYNIPFTEVGTLTRIMQFAIGMIHSV